MRIWKALFLVVCLCLFSGVRVLAREGAANEDAATAAVAAEADADAQAMEAEMVASGAEGQDEEEGGAATATETTAAAAESSSAVATTDAVKDVTAAASTTEAAATVVDVSATKESDGGVEPPRKGQKLVKAVILENFHDVNSHRLHKHKPGDKHKSDGKHKRHHRRHRRHHRQRKFRKFLKKAKKPVVTRVKHRRHKYVGERDFDGDLIREAMERGSREDYDLLHGHRHGRRHRRHHRRHVTVNHNVGSKRARRIIFVSDPKHPPRHRKGLRRLRGKKFIRPEFRRNFCRNRRNCGRRRHGKRVGKGHGKKRHGRRRHHSGHYRRYHGLRRKHFPFADYTVPEMRKRLHRRHRFHMRHLGKKAKDRWSWVKRFTFPATRVSLNHLSRLPHVSKRLKSLALNYSVVPEYKPTYVKIRRGMSQREIQLAKAKAAKAIEHTLASDGVVDANLKRTRNELKKIARNRAVLFDRHHKRGFVVVPPRVPEIVKRGLRLEAEMKRKRALKHKERARAHIEHLSHEIMALKAEMDVLKSAKALPRFRQLFSAGSNNGGEAENVADKVNELQQRLQQHADTATEKLEAITKGAEGDSAVVDETDVTVDAAEVEKIDHDLRESEEFVKKLLHLTQ